MIYRLLSFGPKFDPFRGLTIFSLVGLSFLYASAFFLPPVSATGAYFLQSQNLFRLIVVPSLLGVFFVGCFIAALTFVARRWFSSVVATVIAVLCLSVMGLLGIKSILLAAGYDWRNLIWRGPDLLESERYIKAAAYLVMVALFWFSRRYLAVSVRALSSIGFAVAVLAAVRLVMLSQVMAPVHPIGSGLVVGLEHSRRVVWVIMDEMDSEQIFGDAQVAHPEYVNLNKLASVSVFAQHANSPASATIYSVPALLTGTAIEGNGIQISSSGVLFLERSDKSLVPFDESSSIFGKLTASGRTASVLGFYHPYCYLFHVKRCDSFAYPTFGGLYSALAANIPDAFLSRFPTVDDWEAISRDSLRLLPEYLARDDSLTFLHLNFPHLPATYADKLLRVSPSASPLEEYSHNLQMVDAVVGEIMRDLQQQVLRHELLLVVSTDHWLRNRWYQANVSEASRPIPLFLWKVGDDQGCRIAGQVSTVHTAEVIREFLDGKVSTQQEIADWWEHQSFAPSFVAPHT